MLKKYSEVPPGGVHLEHEHPEQQLFFFSGKAAGSAAGSAAACSSVFSSTGPSSPSAGLSLYLCVSGTWLGSVISDFDGSSIKDCDGWSGLSSKAEAL